MSEKRTILPGVQHLRGWAAIAVVLWHANGIMGKPEYLGASPLPMLAYGQFAVSVFFCISGFVITIVTLDRTTLRPRIAVRDYVRHRFVRIVPFLWICVIGYNVLTALGTHQVEWWPMLRALVAWPVLELKPNVVWSLRHEFLFYAIFAVAMLARWRQPWLLYAWFLAPIPALIAHPFVEAWIGAAHPQLLELYTVLLCGSLVGANLQFGAGYLVGLAWMRGRAGFGEILPGWPWLGLAAMIACTAIEEWIAAPFGLERALVWTLFGVLPLYIALIMRTPFRGPFHRLAMVLGNASFAIYLVHNAALLAGLAAARKLHLAPSIPLLIGLWIAAVASGVAVHYLIEAPLLRRLTRRRDPLPVAAR